MQVGINTLGIDPQWSSGESIYLRHILEHLHTVQRSAEIVLFTDSKNHDGFAKYRRVRIENPSGLGEAALAENVDLLFSSLNRAPAKPSIPMVLYIMDLWNGTGHNGQSRTKKAALSNVSKANCQHAAAIVVPSEFVKREVTERFGLPLDKIVVAPLGVDAVFERRQQPIVEGPYLLTVGRTEPRKNLSRLIEAFDRLAGEIAHMLVVVGLPGASEPPEWGPRVMRIDHVPTAQLASLYQHCDLCICPSLYEGSGVTALEAMRAGAQVATGRVGGITEVVGDGPIFFNPESVDSMVGSIRRGLQEDAASRLRRTHFAKRLAEKYTWEDCAWQTLSAFRRVRSRAAAENAS